MICRKVDRKANKFVYFINFLTYAAPYCLLKLRIALFRAICENLSKLK